MQTHPPLLSYTDTYFHTLLSFASTMPPTKSKKTARVSRPQGLPQHPAIAANDPLMGIRMGVEQPVRLPDTICDPSAAACLHQEYTVTSDGAGSFVWCEAYNLNYSYNSWTITAGVTSASASTSTAHPQKTAIVAETDGARMIGMKVQVTYIGAAQTAAGYLSFFENWDTTDLNAQNVSDLHTGAEAQVRASDGMVVFLDYSQSPRYEDPSGNGFMLRTFPCACFAATGLPVSSPVFRVRTTRWLEWLPKQAVLSESETAVEPPNPASLVAYGATNTPSTSITTLAGLEGFYKRVKAVANAAYHIAAPLVPYVVPKARQFLQSQMGRAALTGALTLMA